MAIGKTLTNFLSKGIETKWFIISTVGKLDKSCCLKSNIEVVDFDKAEILHREKCGALSLKSCDALKFLPKDKRIDFVEMKSFKNISKNSKINTKDKLQKQITKFDFINKISDSLHIFTAISNHKEINLSGAERKTLKSIPKQAILLTDLDFEEDTINTIMFTLDFLANTSTDIKDLLQDEIDKIGEDTLNNLLKPKLMNCSKFEMYYR